MVNTTEVHVREQRGAVSVSSEKCGSIWCTDLFLLGGGVEGTELIP